MCADEVRIFALDSVHRLWDTHLQGQSSPEAVADCESALEAACRWLTCVKPLIDLQRSTAASAAGAAAAEAQLGVLLLMAVEQALELVPQRSAVGGRRVDARVRSSDAQVLAARLLVGLLQRNGCPQRALQRSKEVVEVVTHGQALGPLWVATRALVAEQVPDCLSGVSPGCCPEGEPRGAVWCCWLGHDC